MYSLFTHPRLRLICFSIDRQEVIKKLQEITTLTLWEIETHSYPLDNISGTLKPKEVAILTNPLSDLPTNKQKLKIRSLYEKDFWIYYEEKPLVVIKKKDREKSIENK